MTEEARRTYRVGCTLTYEVQEPSTLILNIAAMRAERQRIASESLVITPEVPSEEHVESRTNNRYHRFLAPAGDLVVRYTAQVDCAPHLVDPAEITATSPQDFPLDILPYLYPSRFCESDQLMRLAQREFGAMSPGYPQVLGICEWMQRNVDYVAGSTGPLVSAYDTASQRIGVCRDFTHLAIAFCRALNMPARFVSGYAHGLEPPDFHTVFEVWLGGRWYMFDPTGQTSPAGIVRIGTGRDAAEVAFAFIFGPTSMAELNVYCHAETDQDEPITHPAMAVAASC